MRVPRTISELKRNLHIARRAADFLALDPGPPLLADAIDALPDRQLLDEIPEDYQKPISAALDQVEALGTFETRTQTRARTAVPAQD